jgi:ssDNA-binding Zn-finger/Zn-ribbon topoisomerase 1
MKADGSEQERVFDDKPSKKLFIGNLSPTKPLSTVSSIYSKIAPSSAGVEVLIRKSDIERAVIVVTVSVAFYYKVFPKREEQLECFDQQDRGVFSRSLDSQDAEFSGDEGDSSNSGYRLRAVYRKTKPSPLTIEKHVSELVGSDFFNEGVLPEIEGVVKNARQVFNSDSSRYRQKSRSASHAAGAGQDEIVQRSALENEAAWQAFIKEWGEKIPEPKWSIRLLYRISDFNADCIKLTLILENSCEESQEKNDIENSVFETTLAVSPKNFKFSDYILDYLKDDYKYDGNIHAAGINCSTVMEGSTVRIEHMPIYIQKKFKSKNPVDPNFKELSENPIPLLLALYAEMETAVADRESEYKQRQNLTPEGRRRFRDEIDQFIIETRRFSDGINALKETKEAMEAFSLMNKAFAQSSKGFSSWHLFQIVFIVMEIPDILASSGYGSSETVDDVDLIYFPTGGGKTEAYLGLVVFTIFFDRLRGKLDGVSAITRFPLRLLSLQQLQRIADIFAKAEILRRSHAVIGSSGFAPFSTGYFVGEGNTPNKVYEAGSKHAGTKDKISPINTESSLKEKYKIISRCPFCGKDTVEVRGDLGTLRIIHQCTNPECREEIPVYISDQEVYRYLPTFIISTLDKLASAAWSKEFKSIFGGVAGKCPRHGYFSGTNCLYWKKPYYYDDPNLCSVTEYLPARLHDPVPTLIIQDEMHLIRESLGTYDSHYETYLEHYMGQLSGEKPVKIIGSSATMTEYWEQIRQLYMKKGHQFPSYRRFYAEEDPDETSRLIAGIMPHNKTVIFAVLDLLKFYYKEIQELKRHPRKALELGIGFASEEEVVTTLNSYDLGLSYNLVKLEGDAISQSIKTMVNVDLRREGIREMATARMTGDVTFSDVKEILTTVETPQTDSHLDLIVATSMISHGVDIDKMNFMVFRGMPRNTAEYIQAYSRVGRKYPGIIFVVFNPARERDQSYYKYFEKYHEYKDILVEPVPLNRWAKFAVNRTLPGIFSACVINFLRDAKGNSPYMSKDFRKAFEVDRVITVEQITDFVLACYQCVGQDMGPYFEDYIRESIQGFVDSILSYDGNTFIPFVLSNQPMTSLRDTDIPIEISPSRESFDPMRIVHVQYSRSVE